ncbi:MAG: ABC transporter substrate-binding protein [Trueperaceae bacterium]
MKKQNQKSLLEALAQGKLSRREFLRKSAAVGLSLPVAGALFGSSVGFAQAGDGLDQVVWISPRGTLEVLDDYNLWVPEKLGYFEDLGLSVELQPGPLEALAVTRFVATNQADVGYPSPGVFLASLDAGMDIVMPWEMMVGQVFNFAVAPDSPLNTIADLEGTTIALGSPGWEVIVDPILVEAGVDPSSVTYLQAGNQASRTVETGDADAVLTWQGLAAQWAAQGRNYKYILGREFSDHPSNGYIIRRADLEDDQLLDIWERFFRGVAMGFEFARINPRAAAQLTYEEFPGLQDQMEPQLAMDSLLELAESYYGSYRLGQGYGWSNIPGWQNYIDTVHELGQIQNRYDANDVVTNQLITEANNFDAEKVAADAADFNLDEQWQQVEAPDVLATIDN